MTERDSFRHFVLISSGNPLHLIDLRADFNIVPIILYDHRGEFIQSLGIYSYPFNIIVDEELSILAAHTGKLTKDEIVNIAISNGKELEGME